MEVSALMAIQSLYSACVFTLGALISIVSYWIVKKGRKEKLRSNKLLGSVSLALSLLTIALQAASLISKNDFNPDLAIKVIAWLAGFALLTHVTIASYRAAKANKNASPADLFALVLAISLLILVSFSYGASVDAYEFDTKIVSKTDTAANNHDR